MAKGKYEYWTTPEGLTLIEGYARNGLTDEQISRKIGISRSTLNEWRKRFPDIANALKKGKEVVDNEAENALLKRALGFRATETIRERDESGELVITKEVTKDVPPDTTALIYWLKNRRPEKWRQNPQPEHTAGGLAEFISRVWENRGGINGK